MKILIITMLLMSSSFANVLVKQDLSYKIKKSTFSVGELVENYAKIKGYSLLIEKKLKGEFKVLGPKKILLEELDLFVSAVASSAGYSILTSHEVKQLEVINTRDVRYRGGGVVTQIDDVPNTYNYSQFVMKLKHAEARDISRNMRPFMSRYGRVIDEKNSNTLIIADYGKNIKRLHSLINKLDTPDFTKRKELIKKINKTSKREIQKSKSVLAYLKDQHVLFLIAFALIGGIIGFGTRGYLMKRIEGGW